MPIPHPVIEPHARAIAAEFAPPAGYPATGRGWLQPRLGPTLRRCGWPVEQIEALLPSASAAPSARHKPYVRQPVAVAPLPWLEELARRLECELSELCRGVIPDE